MKEPPDGIRRRKLLQEQIRIERNPMELAHRAQAPHEVVATKRPAIGHPTPNPLAVVYPRHMLTPVSWNLAGGIFELVRISCL
jgi:hypothetical protein